MDKIIKSLHIIRTIDLAIQKYLEALSNVEQEKYIYHGIRGQILILANSFIDEWDKYLVPRSTNDEFNKMLINAKKLSKPAVKRIREWKGIKDFRNSVLAHNFRDKKNNYESVFLTDKFDKIEIPGHISELILLSKCIKIARTKVCEPFKTKLEETKDMYFEDKGNNTTVVDLYTEIKTILNEIKIIEQSTKTIK